MHTYKYYAGIVWHRPQTVRRARKGQRRPEEHRHSRGQKLQKFVGGRIPLGVKKTPTTGGFCFASGTWGQKGLLCVWNLGSKRPVANHWGIRLCTRVELGGQKTQLMLMMLKPGPKSLPHNTNPRHPAAGLTLNPKPPLNPVFLLILPPGGLTAHPSWSKRNGIRAKPQREHRNEGPAPPRAPLRSAT